MTGLLVVAIIVLIITSVVLFIQNRAASQQVDLLAHTVEQMKKGHSDFINKLQFSHSDNLNKMQQQMQNLAGEQFQRWRDKECENIRTQEREIALREASTQLEQWRYQSEATIRGDAIQRSQSVIIGKVSEHLLPYMPDFPFNPRDVKFIGSPIDLIVFDGLSEGEVKQIVFIEIKTGQSASLTPRERQIRDIVKDRKILWSEMRIRREETQKDLLSDL